MGTASRAPMTVYLAVISEGESAVALIIASCPASVASTVRSSSCSNRPGHRACLRAPEAFCRLLARPIFPRDEKTLMLGVFLDPGPTRVNPPLEARAPTVRQLL